MIVKKEMGHGHHCGGHGHGYGHVHGGYEGMKEMHHGCPVCGSPHYAETGFGAKGAGFCSGKLVDKAVKKLLIEKTKAKIDERWGDKLDAIAQDLVDSAEAEMKMKKEMWKQKKEMKKRIYEILAEESEEE
jgi:uncharacterized Zn finger protein (UPF0148 family)